MAKQKVTCLRNKSKLVCIHEHKRTHISAQLALHLLVVKLRAANLDLHALLVGRHRDAAGAGLRLRSLHRSAKHMDGTSTYNTTREGAFPHLRAETR